MGWLNINGNWIGRHSGKSWSSYWTKQTLLKYGARSGLDIPELISSRNAKIVPSCGYIDSNNYAATSISNFQGSDQTGFIEAKIYFDGTNDRHVIFGSNDVGTVTRVFIFDILNKKPRLLIQYGSTFNNIITSDATLIEGFHVIRISCDGTNYFITIDGESTGFAVFGREGDWLGDVPQRDNVTIGAYINTIVNTTVSAFKIIYVNYNDEHKWIVTGYGSNIFDSLGTVHLAWTGTTHQVYDLNASQELLDNGFSVWAKAGSPNEYVPYKDGLPNDVSAYLVGYAKLIDRPGGATIYNYAPSLVDFNYLDSAHADLIVFDKSNSTYHIAVAGMSYYDASNVYRWREDELASPQIYSDTYKNVGYKGRMMIKGTVLSSLVIDFSECRVLIDDQTGNKEWNLAQLCTLEDLVVQAGGVPVYDDDNYLTWI